MELFFSSTTGSELNHEGREADKKKPGGYPAYYCCFRGSAYFSFDSLFFIFLFDMQK